MVWTVGENPLPQAFKAVYIDGKQKQIETLKQSPYSKCFISSSDPWSSVHAEDSFCLTYRTAGNFRRLKFSKIIHFGFIFLKVAELTRDLHYLRVFIFGNF